MSKYSSKYTTQNELIKGDVDKKKLTPEEQEMWEKKMTAYANYVYMVDTVVVGIMKIVNEKMSGTAQKVLLSSCDATISGLQSVFSMFKTGYSDAKEGYQPDFSKDVPFPPDPPGPPTPGHEISWFQVAWDAVESVLTVAALHSPKLAEILGPLKAAGDTLVKDLNKYFPPKHGEILPAPVKLDYTTFPRRP